MESRIPNAIEGLYAQPDISFVVLGQPRAKPRQSRRDTFQPSKAVQDYRLWSDCVQRVALRNGSRPYQGPVALAARFSLPIPTSWSKMNQAFAESGLMPHVSKPDLDNLIKGIMDPLSGLIWIDDRQIVEYRWPTDKQYAAAEHVGVRLDIWFLE